MKHVLFALACFALAAPAFADENVATADSVVSADRGPGDNIGLRPGNPNVPGNPGDHHGPQPGPHPGPHPGPRPGFVCVAVNRRQQQFVGRDFIPQRAQQEALRNCMYYSGYMARSCRVVGCRVGF